MEEPVYEYHFHRDESIMYAGAEWLAECVILSAVPPRAALGPEFVFNAAGLTGRKYHRRTAKFTSGKGK